MFLRLKASLLLAVHLASGASLSSAAVAVGDKVCTVGYLMDNFCLYDNNCADGGFPNCQLLDNPGTLTLEAPEKHQIYCLTQVAPCIESGYQVLGPKDPATGMHSLGYRLDSTDEVVALGETLRPGRDFRATVRGTVKEAGDGTTGREGPPLLTDLEVLAADVGCEGEAGDVEPAGEEPTGSASAASSRFMALVVVASASLAI